MRALFLFISVIFCFCPFYKAYPADDTVKFLTVDFPPYSYGEGGKIKGIQVDIVRRMCEIANIKYEIELEPFKRAFVEVLKYDESKYDAIFNFYKNPERLKQFEYSDPILENPLVFFIKKDSAISFDGDISKLKGKKIGVLAGYTYSPEFSKAIEDGVITAEESPSHDVNFKKLESRRIDLYPVEKFVGIYTAKKEKVYDYLQIMEKPLIIQYGHVGMAKSNPKVKYLKPMSEALKTLKQSGEYQKIFDSYLYEK